MARSNYSDTFYATVGPRPIWPTDLPNGYTDGHLWVRCRVGTNPTHQWVGPIENTDNGIGLCRTFAARKMSDYRSDRKAGRFNSVSLSCDFGKRYWQVYARQWKIVPIDRVTPGSYREGLRRGDNRFGVMEQRANKTGETDLTGNYGGYFPEDYPITPVPIPLVPAALFGRLTNNLEIKDNGSEYFSNSLEGGNYAVYSNGYNTLGFVNGGIAPIFSGGYTDLFPIMSEPQYAPDVTPFGTRERVRWSEGNAGGYAPYTIMPVILGPIMQQGEAISPGASETFQRSGLNSLGFHSPTVQVFIPKPMDKDGKDTLILDDGKTRGMFLLGYRARFAKVRRYAEGITQELSTSAPSIVKGELTYDADITRRYIAQVPTQFQSYGQPKQYTYSETFRFDQIETLLTEPYRPAPDTTSTPFPYNDGSWPLDTVLTDQPYWFAPGPVYNHLFNGAINSFYKPGAPDVVGSDGSVPGPFATFNGTYLSETTYAFSAVFVTRAADNSVTYQYGAETLSTIAVMPRRMEPIAVMSDPKKYTVSGLMLERRFLWDITTETFNNGVSQGKTKSATGFINTGWSCASANNGFLIKESWYGEELANDGPRTGQLGKLPNVEYIGYYYPLPVSKQSLPVPPFIWSAYRTTSGVSFDLTQWNAPINAQAHQGPIDGPAYPLLGNSGDAWNYYGWAIIPPFAQGGSVPYTMPPANATTETSMGVPVVVPAGNFNVPTPPETVKNYQDLLVWSGYIGKGTDTAGNTIVNDTATIRNDAFYAVSPPPPYQPAPVVPAYRYAGGVITVFFSDDGGDASLYGFYNGNVAITIKDARNVHNLAYWQDYGANIMVDRPSGGVPPQGTVDDPPGKIVLGYDLRTIIPLGPGLSAYNYSGPHYATGPVRMFLNADINLSNGKGVRSAANKNDPPVFPPFVVLTPHSTQGPGIGVLQVECNDGTSRNVQVYLAPPKVLP